MQLINVILAISAIASAIFAYFTWKSSLKHVQIEYVFHIYKDIIKWLNSHKGAHKWVYDPKSNQGLLKENWDNWGFDDFLGYFEAIWSLKKKGAIDIELVYDLLSDFLFSMLDETDELKNCIQQLRSEFKKEKGYPSDYYKGISELYAELKKYQKTYIKI